MPSKLIAVSLFLLICASPFKVCAADWNPLPDTGQTSCYDENGNNIPCPSQGQILHGQDANYNGISLNYQDNGNGTITDLNTGLMWQQSDNSSLYEWPDAVTYCNGLSSGGHSDWRLPSRIELRSIADFGRSVPAHNPIFIWSAEGWWVGVNEPDGVTPYTHETWMRDYSFWWSNDVYTPNNTFSWVVHFYDGADYHSDTRNTHFVRCVRGDL